MDVNMDIDSDIGAPKDHINIRILHSGLKAQYKGATRNQGL